MNYKALNTRMPMSIHDYLEKKIEEGVYQNRTIAVFTILKEKMESEGFEAGVKEISDKRNVKVKIEQFQQPFEYNDDRDNRISVSTRKNNALDRSTWKDKYNLLGDLGQAEMDRDEFAFISILRDFFKRFRPNNHKYNHVANMKEAETVKRAIWKPKRRKHLTYQMIIDAVDQI